MLNLIQHRLLQNYRSTIKLPLAAYAYQFRVETQPYYPNRQSEIQRTNLLNQSQIVAEAEAKKNMPKDYYYKLLGVRRSATTQQIKSAYYSLAKEFHPDSSNTPMERKKFQEISNAYHILTDETKRLEYDQLGAVRDEKSFLKSISNNIYTGNKSDIYTPATKEDIARITKGELRLDLEFLESAHGVKKNLDVRVLKKCPMCHGKSQNQITLPDAEKCRKCNGTGRLTKRTPTFTSLIICDQCAGKRYINRNSCETCDNKGLVLETVKVVVHIPPGIKTGDILPVQHPQSKQRASYRVHVAESDYFKREGNDIYTVTNISISDAILGGSYKLRGIHEDIEIKTIPGMESHTQVMLKGKGIRSREGIGNHIVTFKVRIPRSLSTKQRQLILAWAKTEETTQRN